MSYLISFLNPEDQTLYARIQRKSDSKWWDEVAGSWVTTATSDCDLSLTESTPGSYSATASSTMAAGTIYTVNIYDSSDNLMAYTEDIYQPPYESTVLDIINDVQGELRLPKSTTLDTHALLLLGFLNTVQDLMMELAVWDELKVSGGIVTDSGDSVYMISPANAGHLDIIRNLQIGTYDPIINLSDGDFKEFVRNNGTNAQPTRSRIYGRAGKVVYVQLAATPDDSYQIDYEALQKPDKLSAATDIPLLDPMVMKLGLIYLAKMEQGEDYRASEAVFQSKLNLKVEASDDSNLGDIEGV